MKILHLIDASFLIPIILFTINGMKDGAYYQHEFKLLFHFVFIWFGTAAVIINLKKYFEK